MTGQPALRSGPAGRRLLIPIIVGAAVSLALGVYGRNHNPTGKTTLDFGFSSMFAMKSAFATVAAVLALVQLYTAARMYGRIGSGPPSSRVALTHRTSGAIAVLFTLPVAYHCLWSLGYQTYSTRVAVHSLVGCAFYGAFVAKMLALQTKRLPGWALPLLGGLTFAALVTVWLTSALWWFSNGRPGY